MVLKFKTMVGTVAPYTGANAIRGIVGAGSPWSIDTANGKLEANGDLSIKVTGLIITGTGANPVPEFRAVVSCQSIADGAAVVVNRVTAPFPATTSPHYTSVGATAIRRWLVPVTYQDFPDELLPEPLRGRA